MMGEIGPPSRMAEKTAADIPFIMLRHRFTPLQYRKKRTLSIAFAGRVSTD